MASSELDRLARIGNEGFALIDEGYGRGSRGDRSEINRLQRNRLARIGNEGFALIDEAYGRTSSKLQNNYQSQYQQPLVYRGPQISTVRMSVVTSNCEIAQHYYTGMAVREHGNPN
ncbi:hypothetical protein MANES_15G010500v8 [Manihot esculenta]|uniref:Uncharacterized protein n=1 Tax=Manihot esculenta TaxID=3983 RepID=A0A2C9UCX3_MANES|nr:hypothetical protein MANES_15G010500v8 [Manihot esculenta]